MVHPLQGRAHTLRGGVQSGSMTAVHLPMDVLAHSRFFDHLVDLIPAKFYHTEEEPPQNLKYMKKDVRCEAYPSLLSLTVCDLTPPPPACICRYHLNPPVRHGVGWGEAEGRVKYWVGFRKVQIAWKEQGACPPECCQASKQSTKLYAYATI